MQVMELLLKRLENHSFEKRISQEELAKKLDVAFSTVNRWFNGKVKPNKSQRHQIEKLLLTEKGISMKRIDEINRQHNEIYKEYAKSDKTRFAYYWEQLARLEEEYWKEKHGSVL